MIFTGYCDLLYAIANAKDLDLVREISRAKGRATYAKNPQPQLIASKRRAKEKPVEIRLYHRKYRREKRRNDLSYRLQCNLANRIWGALSGRFKSARTVALLGCSVSSFVIYLESRFEPGMNWENYGAGFGKWQIDHIIPCAIFDLSREDHQRRCFHFSNLQPLWTPENIRKSDHFDLALLQKNDTPEHQDRYPAFCWKKNS